MSSSNPVSQANLAFFGGAATGGLAHLFRKGNKARAQSQQDLDALIQRQEDAARMQQEKLARNQRNTKARSKAIETRGAALRNQRKTRSAMRPRSGTVLTGERNRGSILGGTGRTSIIGG